jgi:peptidoglycan hydrolase CwlO-like protein
MAKKQSSTMGFYDDCVKYKEEINKLNADIRCYQSTIEGYEKGAESASNKIKELTTENNQLKKDIETFNDVLNIMNSIINIFRK